MAIPGFFCLALALYLYHLDFQSIWWDEGHSIQMASAALGAIPILPGMDVHPPGYFFTLHLWMDLAGRSEFALRYLSVGFTLLTLALLIRFGRDLAGWRAAWWAGLFALLSPFYVAYAQEVRMYAMVAFWAAASTYFLWRILFSSDSKTGDQKQEIIGYILLTAAALYTHYFSIFLLAFQNTLWGLWWLGGSGRRLERLKLWWGSQAGVFLLFLPQLRLAFGQVTEYANPNLTPPPLGHYLSRTWQAYTLGLTIDPTQARPYLIGLALVAVLGSLIYLRRWSRQALWLWFALPLTLYFGVLQIRPSFEPRYLIMATPPLFLILGLIAGRPGRLNPLFGLLVLISLGTGLSSYFTNPAYFKDEAGAVVAWLAQETSPDDVVFVDVPHPFHYYADQIPAPTRYLFVDVHQAAERLNQTALGRDRLFWVTWWGSDTDPRGVIDFLVQKQAGPPLGERQFKGYRVVWYDLSDRPFSLPGDLPPLEVNFDNKLLLDGLAYSQDVRPGRLAWATLHFSQLAPLTVNYKVSLRLRGADGSVLSQVDKLLLNDRHFQTSAWPLDDPALNQAINVYLLPLGESDYQGQAVLEAVVYEAETLAAIAAYGVPTTNDDFVSARIGSVQIGENKVD